MTGYGIEPLAQVLLMPNYVVIIPSKNPQNCVDCVRAVLEREPELPPHRIVVVDDGARAEAEAELPGVTWLAGVEPFVFSRNVNIGVRHAFAAYRCDGVVVLNDDARLLTDRGFTRMAQVAEVYMGHHEIGLLSPTFTDAVGNPRQISQIHRRVETPQILRVEPRVLAFVCVYIPRQTWEDIGELDERYTAYGWDDNDYCRRVLNADRRLLITEDCLLEHGQLPSTFRPHNVSVPIDAGRKIYEDKWEPHTE